MMHEQARLGELLSPYDRADPPAEDDRGFLGSDQVKSLIGGLIFTISASIKAGVETRISGAHLLVAATIGLAYWIAFASPFLLWFGTPGAVIDRGWGYTWRRVNLFVGGVLGFIVAQVATELWVRGWQDQGVASYEAAVELVTFVLVGFVTLHFLERVPGARSGLRTL